MTRQLTLAAGIEPYIFNRPWLILAGNEPFEFWHFSGENLKLELQKNPNLHNPINTNVDD